MAHPFRLLLTGSGRAGYNMALDDAILESVSSGLELPTLRLYGWNPAAISIGSSEDLHTEVDTEACRRHGFDVVRRCTGGGSVFHQHEITYSLVLGASHPLADGDIIATYRSLCRGLIESLAILGVESSFAPINDIVTHGKKISGNAQTRRRGTILQHGTVLLDLELELMFSLLTVSEEKLRRKAIADARERVTSLAELGLKVGFPEAEAALIEGFSRALDLDYRAVAREPSLQEAERAREIAARRYDSELWTCRRESPY